MSKNRDLIYDMADSPETEDFEQLDSEPLQLGGVGEDAPAADDRQVTTPGDVHVAPQMPTPIDGTLRQFALRVPDVIDACSGIMVFGKRIKSLVFSTDLSIIRNVNADAVFAVYPFTPQPIITQALLMASDLPVFVGVDDGKARREPRHVRRDAGRDRRGRQCADTGTHPQPHPQQRRCAGRGHSGQFRHELPPPH